MASGLQMPQGGVNLFDPGQFAGIPPALNEALMSILGGGQPVDTSGAESAVRQQSQNLLGDAFAQIREQAAAGGGMGSSGLTNRLATATTRSEQGIQGEIAKIRAGAEEAQRNRQAQMMQQLLAITPSLLSQQGAGGAATGVKGAGGQGEFDYQTWLAMESQKRGWRAQEEAKLRTMADTQARMNSARDFAERSMRTPQQAQQPGGWGGGMPMPVVNIPSGGGPNPFAGPSFGGAPFLNPPGSPGNPGIPMASPGIVPNMQGVSGDVFGWSPPGVIPSWGAR